MTPADIQQARAIIEAEWDDGSCPRCHRGLAVRDEQEPIGPCDTCRCEMLDTALDALEAARREVNQWIEHTATFVDAAASMEARCDTARARIAALEADLAAERAAHAETSIAFASAKEGVLALCDAVAPGRADVDFADRATLTRQLEALHRDTIGKMLVALGIKDTGLDGALSACRALVADRDAWKARAEALEKVAAHARHANWCTAFTATAMAARSRNYGSACDCGMDDAMKAAGL